MAFPSPSQVETAAAQTGIDTDTGYAFASYYERVPATPAEATAFLNMLNGHAQSFENGYAGEGVDFPAAQRYMAAFVTANRMIPPTAPALIAWLTRVGAWGNGPTGSLPYPGQFYPPGGAAITTPVPTTPTVTYSAIPAAPGTAGLSSSGLGGITGIFGNLGADFQAHEKAILIGGGLLGAFWLGIPQRILGSLGRHRRY